jgi:hypothetical protein
MRERRSNANLLKLEVFLVVHVQFCSQHHVGSKNTQSLFSGTKLCLNAQSLTQVPFQKSVITDQIYRLAVVKAC